MKEHGLQRPIRALYLEGRGETTFAMFHDVASHGGRAAVLIVPPFGWEPLCTYRDRREWARQLSAEGHPALHIDLPGSGDSSGGPLDQDRLQAWTRSIDLAARWLAERAGASSVTLAGVGMGGFVGVLAAAAGAPLDAIALLAVPNGGAVLVRELQLVSRLPVSRVSDPATESPSPLPDGSVLAAGYVLSGETARALQGLRLDELDMTAMRAQRALLLGRRAEQGPDPLATALQEAGLELESEPGPANRSMAAVSRRFASWLGQGPRASRSPGTPRKLLASTIESESLVLHDERARETPLWLEIDSARLFGVLTEPLDAPPELSVVLFNPGPQRHTGPNRMWVEMARRWARHGVATLRVDLARIGDADGDASVLQDPDSLYEEEYAAQALAVLDVLAQRGLPERFMLGGLCAGAYWALQAALRDRRVSGALLVNPRFVSWRLEQRAAARLRRLRASAASRQAWRRALSGEVSLASHRVLARGASAAVSRRLKRDGRGRLISGHSGPSGPPDADRVFDALAARGQRAVVVFSGGESLRAEFDRDGVFERAARWPGLELRRIGTDDQTHMVSPLWLQHEVHASADRLVLGELATGRPRPRAAAL